MDGYGVINVSSIQAALMRELIEKLTRYRSQFTADDLTDYYTAYGQKVLALHSGKLDFTSIEESMCLQLQELGRDLDVIALKKLLRKLNSLVTVHKKVELLEFFRQIVSSKTVLQNSLGRTQYNGQEFSSSGVFSGTFGSTIESNPGLLRSNSSLSNTADHHHQAQSNLWGQPARQPSERRLPSGSSGSASGSASSSASHMPPNPSRLFSVAASVKPTERHPSRINGPSQPTVAETDLVRELLFVLNSVSGSVIKFDPIADAFKCSPDFCVPAGQQDSVLTIAECGWLHQKIQQFVSQAQLDQSVGCMAGSLSSGLHEHLTEYYRLIATLESQFNKEARDGLAGAPSYMSPTADLASQSGNIVSQTLSSVDKQLDSGKHAQSLTLTCLLLWTQEPRYRLTFLASLCDACQGRRGGALASIVFGYTQHGNPDFSSLARHLLVKVASSLLEFISQWIYDGQLDDPAQEFFVACHPAVKLERLWHERYSIRRHMLPDFITSNQASKILLAGKSVNFLQQVCGEKQGIKDREVIRNTRLKHVEALFDQELDNSFDHMISSVYKQTSRYLLETLIDRYHFLDHLRATRQFLLLGQGDFIRHLMDLLDEDLSKPATSLLRHQLRSTLETAIRDTNAQYEDPEILQRLDVRLLDISPDETGWDVFSLDYRVDGPLATIFTEDCRLMYLRAFNFLWRAKRMEFSLSNLWKHQLIAGRLSHGLQVDLGPVLHMSQLLGAEIRHCVQQLQYYVSFEVLECAWEVLVKRIHAATDLDEVIDAHQVFLSNVITRCLLDAASRQLIGQLRTIFDLILNFNQMHHEFNVIALQELESREQFLAATTASEKDGKWSTDKVRESQERLRRAQFIQKNVGPFQARIRILTSSYREMLISFIRMLCDHPDPSLRSLADHLNFNKHYQHPSLTDSVSIVGGVSGSQVFTKSALRVSGQTTPHHTKLASHSSSNSSINSATGTVINSRIQSARISNATGDNKVVR